MIGSKKVEAAFVGVALIVGLTWAARPIDNSLTGEDQTSRNVCLQKAPVCDSVNNSRRNAAESICWFGCCSKAVEEELQDRSENDIIQIMNNFTNSTLDLFSLSRLKFDDYFTGLLDHSVMDLHNMFVRTYGLLYQQNSDIFMDLFDNLRQYYKGQGQINLTKVVNKFFSVLMQRIFVLLNAQHEFDDFYLACVSRNVKKIKPFGDVPSKLLSQIKRSFVAAKALVQGLVVAENVTDVVSKAKMDDSCMRRFTRMLHCSTCSGFPCAKPCVEYCRTVTAKCLIPLSDEFSEVWIIYIDELVKLTERLEGPFNIEKVVDPIEVLISEAIMNFQTNFDSLSAEIFSECGKPELRAERRRRTLNMTQVSEKKRKKSETTMKNEQQEDPMQMDQLLREIRPRIQSARLMWNTLVNLTCDNLGSGDMNSSCWNGTQLIRRDDSIIVDLDDFRHLPDMNFQSRVIIHQQMAQLQSAIVWLKMAISGLDSHAGDGYEISLADGSGSGSDNYNDDDDSDGSGQSMDQLNDHQHHKMMSPSDSVTIKNSIEFQRNDHFAHSLGCCICLQPGSLLLVLCFVWLTDL